MSAAASPRRRGSSRLWWILAGDCSLAAFALAELDAGSHDISFLLWGGSVLLAALFAAAAIVAGRRERASRGSVARLARAGVVVGAALGAGVLISGWIGADLTVLLVAVFAGMALVAQWLVGVVERPDEDETPWDQLATGAPAGAADSGSGEPGPAARAGAPRWRAGGALLGAGLLVLVTYDVLVYGQIDDAFGVTGTLGKVVALMVLAGLVLLLAGPLVVAAQVGALRDRRLRERAQQRQAVAAHLHDSVLQTLALIQRSAGDPEQVRHLARRQERGLRAWLAGGDETQGASLAAAIQSVASEVEDESGLAIECVLGGDLGLDARSSALAQAAREALRNAARHGGRDVRVFLDVDPGGATVFVRDGGRGFDPDRVPAERGGVRDAIIGRMQSVGGTVTIDSAAAGTEVALRLPRKPGAAS